MENQALPRSALWDAKPMRGEENGVRGDRAPSHLVIVECRDRKIEGAERGQLLTRQGALILHISQNPNLA